ncbi:MAG: hypothetical protein WCP52_01550 [Bacteroidota bacterium]
MKRLKKRVLRPMFTITFNSLSVVGLSQDTIAMNDRSLIIAKVTEIYPLEIRYKKFNNQQGPDYIINKTEVLCITYKNGTVDSFPVSKPWFRPLASKPINVIDTLENLSISKKITNEGNCFFYGNEILTENNIHVLMKRKNNKELSRYANKAKISKAFQPVTIVGFPLATFGALLLLNDLTSPPSSSPKDARILGNVLLALSAICLSSTIYLNWNRKKQNKKAINLYNQLY